MKKQITEEMGVHKEWFKEAKKVTPNTLQAFLDKLMNDYSHDYGTICHAIVAGSVATARAINRSPQGGITGFQAGCIMWGFVQQWMSYENQPMALIKYENMLYPQYADRFHSISKDTFEWLVNKAKENIRKVLIWRKFGKREILWRRFDGWGGHYRDRMPHPDVWRQWKFVADGGVPFGYYVEQ